MANFVYDDAHLTVNGVDLSAYVRKATVSGKADLQENTAMGADWKTRLVGLLDWELEIEFNQDFALAQVDATLWAVFVGRAPVVVTIRPTSAAIGATNPDFTGSACLEEYSPLGGEVGEVVMAPVKFMGNGVLARDTTP